MWWSSRSHASEMSDRSSPDGVGPQSELAVLPRPPNVPDAPRRARVSSERSNRAAPRPSLTPNGILPRLTTHLALHGLPSFQRRGSPDSWCVDDAPRRRRRPKVSGRAHEQRQRVGAPSRAGLSPTPASRGALLPRRASPKTHVASMCAASDAVRAPARPSRTRQSGANACRPEEALRGRAGPSEERH